MHDLMWWLVWGFIFCQNGSISIHFELIHNSLKKINNFEDEDILINVKYWGFCYILVLKYLIYYVMIVSTSILSYWSSLTTDLYLFLCSTSIIRSLDRFFFQTPESHQTFTSVRQSQLCCSFSSSSSCQIESTFVCFLFESSSLTGSWYRQWLELWLSRLACIDIVIAWSDWLSSHDAANRTIYFEWNGFPPCPKSPNHFNSIEKPLFLDRLIFTWSRVFCSFHYSLTDRQLHPKMIMVKIQFFNLKNQQSNQQSSAL